MITNHNIIAFDYGIKYIGVAISQWVTCIPKPLTIFVNYNYNTNWRIIKYLLNKWRPKIVIIGLPLNIKGKNQKITNKTKQFANQIKNNYNICVILHDERFSTKEARCRLFKIKGYKFLKKKYIDKESATIILENWFNIFFKNK
ncbi:MAG: Holliday junction resolvase RuvX [gamma proteobacterium endosymbiont of Trioza apicalis]